MLWGSFPLVGVVLGLTGGIIQFFLLKKLISTVGKSDNISLTLALLTAKLALYGILLAPAFVVSVTDGAVCGTIMVVSMVALSVYKAFRKGGKKHGN